MKKKYSLDYNIERDIDRLHAVEDILDRLDTTPNSVDLEQMASYILYGKDENGQNAAQRHETTKSDARYKNYQLQEDKNLSLDAILDNPIAGQENLQTLDTKYIYTKKKPTIKKPKYDKNTGELIDPGDSNIPGMIDLWATIERLDRTIAANEGKIPFTDDIQVFKDDYRFYQFKHMAIDVRRHQYYLKDAYKPTLHFLNLTPPKPQTYNWDSDSYYWMPQSRLAEKVKSLYNPAISSNPEDYERRTLENGEEQVKWVVRQHTFDWENPKHIRCLIDHYAQLYMQMWDKVDSWGRILIYDFDRYFNMAHFSALREYVLTRKIDGLSASKIAAELQEKFGIVYNESNVCNILYKEIPEVMVKTVKKHRLEIETPQFKKKQCDTCGNYYPRDTLFFGRNNARPDKFMSCCKECEKKKRIQRGQSATDGRTKDATMPKM